MNSNNWTEDPAIRSILLANGLALVMAVILGWRMLHLLWPFWIQSVIIGVFGFRRIRAMGEVRRPPDWRLDPEAQSEARSTAWVFAAHYGMFHLFYLFILLAMSFDAQDGVIQVQYANTGVDYAVEVGTVGWIDALAFVVLALGFWRTHAESARHHQPHDLAGSVTPTQLMLVPYLRVGPMHMTLILGIAVSMFTGWYALVALLFIVLKTAADLGMHVLEHHLLARSAQQERAG